MQNRYAGDVGDFGKFGLLRALFGGYGGGAGSGLRLGIIWYLHPDESHNLDGKLVRYLDGSTSNEKLHRTCDPPLYKAMRSLVNEPRSVQRVPGLRILPTNTVYFDELLFDVVRSKGLRPEERKAQRRSWAGRAAAATASCDAVLLDPDNGLECSVKLGQPKAGKYAYFEEVLPLVNRGQSVIIYQHLDRSAKAHDQITRRAQQLRERITSPSKIYALRHLRGARAYFILVHPQHEPVIAQGLKQFLAGPWSIHFQLVTPAPLLAN